MCDFNEIKRLPNQNLQFQDDPGSKTIALLGQKSKFVVLIIPLNEKTMRLAAIVYIGWKQETSRGFLILVAITGQQRGLE